MADDTTQTAAMRTLNPTPELKALWEAHEQTRIRSAEARSAHTKAQEAERAAWWDFKQAQGAEQDAYAAWSAAKRADMKARGEL